MSMRDQKEAKRLFQKRPFCNVLIEKPRIKRLKNIVLLHELSFYDELSIEKISKAFTRYARSYRTQIIDLKDPLVQLEPSKSGIIDLFKDLLVETNGFKYQITMKLLLRKYKVNGGIKFDYIHFNSTTKINSEYGTDKYFQEILYKINN